MHCVDKCVDIPVYLSVAVAVTGDVYNRVSKSNIVILFFADSDVDELAHANKE